MYSYDKQKERLKRLTEECLMDIENDESERIEDDEDSPNEIDNIEERSDSETEQEINVPEEQRIDDMEEETRMDDVTEDEEIDNELLEDLNEPHYKGKDATLWRKLTP